MNPDNTPAKGVAVVLEPGTVTGTTAENGMARLTINTGGNLQQLRITVSLLKMHTGTTGRFSNVSFDLQSMNNHYKHF